MNVLHPGGIDSVVVMKIFRVVDILVVSLAVGESHTGDTCFSGRGQIR